MGRIARGTWTETPASVEAYIGWMGLPPSRARATGAPGRTLAAGFALAVVFAFSLPGRPARAQGVPAAAAPSAPSTAVRLTLRDAVARALSDGTAARLSSERVLQSRARELQSRSGLLPQVETEVQDSNQILNLKTFGFTLPGLPSTVGPFNVFDAHVRIASRIIDVAAYRRWLASRQGIVVSEVERRTTENEVAAAVATLYVSLQRAQTSIDAIRAYIIWTYTWSLSAQDAGLPLRT